MRDWARLYQTPLWLAAVFIGLLALFAVTPDPARTAADDSDSRSEPTPGPGECVVCGIDQECDPSSGRCVFIKSTPLPCVENAEFDEKAGFCLPTGAPTPVPQPEPDVTFDEQFPGGGIDRDGDRGNDRRFNDNNFPFEDRSEDQ